MAERLNETELKRILTAGGAELRGKAFEALQALGSIVIQGEESPNAIDLVLRALENRDCFGPAAPIVDALLRQQGLFPYLAGREDLSTQDALAIEFHRPAHLDDVVFHRVQARIYDKLLAGQSVVLSAPTSFGKSLIIDAVIASGIYKNIVLVVPTLALIDETRRRLTARFSPHWKLITHHSQRPEENNVYILTAERIAEFDDFPRMDFFVIDEFYKLSPSRDEDDERCTTLNQALYRLRKQKTPFYLLGPSIKDVPEELKDPNCCFIHTDYKTVASEVVRVQPGADDIATLTALASTISEPTLIYCQSPPRVRTVVKALLDAGVRAAVPDSLLPAANWLGRQFHPEWTLIAALMSGIGVHHGKLPRWLGQYQVRLFNEGALRYLVCTSTLIEGVNTKAKNVIIFDKKVSKKSFDYFTFNNISGRAGRMFQHYVGRVYLFHDPPVDELPVIEVPAVALDESAPDALLLQADPRDVKPDARDKLDHYFTQRVLDVAVLKQNAEIDPERQLELAAVLRRNSGHYWPLMDWNRFPTWEQLQNLCELMWEYFVPRAQGAVFTAKQLAFRVSKLRDSSNIRALIEAEEQSNTHVKCADDAVDNVLDFLRYWVAYNFSKYAIAVNNIQRSVFESMRLPSGDYSVFAAQVQNRFSDPACMAIEEYGVPFQTAKRLEHLIAGDGNLDVTLAKLRGLRVDLGDPFEQELLAEAQRYL